MKNILMAGFLIVMCIGVAAQTQNRSEEEELLPIIQSNTSEVLPESSSLLKQIRIEDGPIIIIESRQGGEIKEISVTNEKQQWRSYEISPKTPNGEGNGIRTWKLISF